MFFNPKGDIKEYIRVSFRRLMIPYIIFSTIGLGINIVFGLADGHSLGFLILSSIKSLANTGTVCSESGHLWFLLGLFISRILLYLSNKYNVLKISLFISVLLVLLLHHLGLKHFWWILYSMTGFLYYGLGYFLREKQYDKLIFFISAIVYVISIILPANFNQYNTQVYSGIIEVAIIYAGFACVFFNNVGKYLLNHKTILCVISKYAMLLYVIHYPVMFAISKTGILSNMNNFYAIVLLNSISIICVTLVAIIFKDKLNKIGL